MKDFMAWFMRKREQPTGMIPDPERDSDPRNLSYEDMSPFGAIDVPEAGDVEIGDWSINQGGTSACTCFSSCYAINQLEGVQLSPNYAFARIKNDPIYPSSRLSYGAFMLDSLKLKVNEGICEFKDAPDGKTSSDSTYSQLNITPSMSASARRHKGGAYIYVTTSASDKLRRFDDIVRYLHEMGQPVKVGVDWRGSFNDARYTGIVPAKLASGSIAGHDMLAVAWKKINGHEYLGFRNSFGATWGDHGRVWLPKGFFNISVGIAYIPPEDVSLPKPAPIEGPRNTHKERANAQELDAMIAAKFPVTGVEQGAVVANKVALSIKQREWLVLWMGVTYRGWTFIDVINYLYARSRGKTKEKAYHLNFNENK